MTVTIPNKEVSTYWELIKDASQQAKLALISMLSASLVTPVERTVGEEKKSLHITLDDLEITPFVATLGQGIKPLPADSIDHLLQES